MAPIPDTIGNVKLIHQQTPALCAELDRRLCGWVPDFTGTLLFLCVHDKLLLIRKKRGHGAGKINAPGGKIDAGETPVDCAVRETREEVGIHVRNPSLMAELRFIDRIDAQWYGYVFVANDYRGTPVESAEAEPFWVSTDAIPYADMWEDDRIWLPEILAGRPVRGDFLFESGKLLSYAMRGWLPSALPRRGDRQ